MYRNFADAAEEKWKEEVLNYAENLFRGHWLPSHDISHHYRVWTNAAGIASEAGMKRGSLYEELFLACFFHDLGILMERSEKHGSISRELCTEFLKNCRTRLEFKTDDLLEAIGFHDDKEYKVQRSDNQVYLLLTLADDMDAFGAIGVYRYIEIYRLRGINCDIIPQRIRENAAGRYKNLKLQFDRLSVATELCRARFEALDKLLQENTYSESAESLVYWIEKEVIIPRSDPFPFFCKQSKVPGDNQRISDFLKQFVKETDPKNRAACPGMQ
jgi:hypothetical protein